MNEPNTNENERTRTECENRENDHVNHLPLEGDPENVHQQLIGKTEQTQEQTEQPQENSGQSNNIVQDMSQCVAKTDIDS